MPPALVFFDVGGVLIRDFTGTDQWARMKRGLGITEGNRGRFEVFWTRWHDRVCTDTDIDSLLPELERECGIRIPPGYSWLADFVGRFEPNPAIIPVVSEVASRTRVGILTDMYPRMFAMIADRGLLPRMDFDPVIDSSAVGLRKPDDRLFSLAGRRAGLKPGDMLLVDNTPSIVEAARSFGWQGYWYDTSDPAGSSAAFLGWYRRNYF